jgi:6-phosphogluconate dehydrogenase
MWTVEAGKELGVPTPVIQGALEFRLHSQNKPSYTGKLISAMRNQFGGHEVKVKK